MRALTRTASTAPRRIGLAVALLLVLAGGVAAPAPADAAAKEDGYAYDLAREVMSPFCPGRTLSSCPSPQAAELIQWVILQENAGATREEVEAQLYARYGDVIRGAPKAEGWGLAAYSIPVGAAVAGVGLVVVVLRRLSGDDDDDEGDGDGPGASPPPPAVQATARTDTDDEIARLVDQELERI